VAEALRDTRQLQAFLRATAAHGRDVVQVGPFDTFFDPADDMKYLNYAIPADGAVPSAAEIDALRDAFRERERLPRLEWIAEAAPQVADSLRQAGMMEELVTPLMACTPDQLRAPAVDARVARATAADAAAARRMLMVAFGQPPPDESEDGARVSAETPRRMVVAWVDGDIASAGSWTPVADGVSEVAGIGTAERYRRRGLAGAITAATARAAFDEGATLCVLSPGDETAMLVYERAGFRRVATMLHWSDDAPSRGRGAT
jgi:ribosomal protein S18 acetylase RimI-like enzyme